MDKESNNKGRADSSNDNVNNNTAKSTRVTITAHAVSNSPHSSLISRSRKKKMKSRNKLSSSQMDVSRENSQQSRGSPARLGSRSKSSRSKTRSKSRSKSRLKSRSQSVEDGMISSSQGSPERETHESDSKSASSRNVSFQEMQENLEKKM